MSTIQRASALAVAILAAAALTACSSDPDDKNPAADPTPESLPLTAHVLQGDDLPGFRAEEDVELLSIEDFAEKHDKTVPELEEAGMVAASASMFAPAEDSEGTAMSIAQQFESSEQAQAEADRLFAANSEVEEGTTITPLEVDGIPGAQAISMTATRGGQELAAVEIVFVDGSVVHETFAFAAASVLSVDDVVAAVRALYEDVQGHPVEG